MRPAILLIVSLFTFSQVARAQETIIQFLRDRQLITIQQLKKYEEKERSDRQYVELMIRLMKKEDGDKEYAKEMEAEYKKEKKEKADSRDTLSILARILEISCESGRVFDNSRPDASQLSGHSGFINRLETLRIISAESAGHLAAYSIKGTLKDSCDIVNQAIGFREKIRTTTVLKLAELTGLLNRIGLLSLEKSQRLPNEQLPDTVNKIKRIVENSDNVFVFDNPDFIRTKNDFDKRIHELSQLTGLEVSNAHQQLIRLDSTPGYYNFIPVTKLNYGGREFLYEGNQVMTTQLPEDIYSLIGYDYYKVFNRILAYKSAPHRLHRINETNPLNFYHISSWNGFILLKNEQSDQLYRNELIDISYEENKSPLSLSEIRRAIRLYQETGLLDGVSPSSIDSVIFNLTENPVFRFNELVSRFPTIGVTIADRIPISEVEAIELVKKMATVSKQAFNPQNPRIEKDASGLAWLMFEIKGNTYREIFNNSWYSVWSPIHNAVFSDKSRKAQFEVLRFSQQHETFIYISPAQLERLEKEKVIGDY